jgi:glycosyltransferase involved in cell wall biosynthesis
MITCLFMSQWGANVGYAIGSLETLFYEVFLELNGGDPSRTHFSYPFLNRGPPRSLPDHFDNVFTFDLSDASAENTRRLAREISSRAVDLVLAFDMQPVHRFWGAARKAGASTLLSYWGARISDLVPAWKLLLKRVEVAWSRSRLDGLIFESQAMADYAILGRGVPSEMVDVVHLGVDLERFNPASSRHVYEELGIPPDRKVVVYAGHMQERKGIRTLVEAAIELLHRRGRRDIQFLICGNKGRESEPYERLYDGLGIDDWIRFAGYRGDMPEIFQSSLCGVIPSSVWDSFPRTSVEMAASGLPVVGSRLDGLPEAILDGKTGLLFEPRNPLDLADKLEMLLDDPDLAARCGRAGRERCERELNLDVQRRNLLTAIRRRL